RLLEHQQEVIEHIANERQLGKNAFLVVLPTGTGKSEILMRDFRNLKESLFDANGLWLVPTRTLRDQALAMLQFRLPELHHSDTFEAKAVEAGFMVQTYQHMIRHYEDFGSDAFRYIAVDEAHHAVAPGLRRVLEHFVPETLIGLTATDERFDEK